MSATGPMRTRAEPERGPSTTFGGRSRVPSSRMGAKERPLSSREVIPEDSASNAPSRRTVSASHKNNPFTKTQMERHVGRIQQTTREKLQIRTQSPVKPLQGPGRGSGSGVRVDPLSSRQTSKSPPGQTTIPDKDNACGLRRLIRRTVKLTVIGIAAWKPQASLAPHTSAPLASRVSGPPASYLLPTSLEPEAFTQMTAGQQEAAILEDLLFVFMGYEGQYIRFVEKYDPSDEKQRLVGPKFKILPGLDPSLRDLTSSVLKMATWYSAVQAFVEVQSREEFGAINHALCASISKMLKEYLVLIAQLEHQVLTNPMFTLHKLHLHTLPTSNIMSQLYMLAQELLKKNSMLEDDLDESVDGFDDVDNILEQLREGGDLVPGSMTKKLCKGGNVLRLLSDRLAFMSGDPAARSLLQTLLRDASKPYMKMLNEWLHHGGIKDPHGEFLIKEQQSIKRERLEEDYTDEYWEKRYTIRENEVPPQLEAVKDKVLLAGKYLNVVRECGGVDITTEVKDVPNTFDDPLFLDNVNAAYAHANSSLLNLLITTHGLSDRLRSMKHYFFLDRSDFFTYFLDLGASELKKPWRLVNVSKLQSLLDLVLRQPGTIAAQDPFKEDVKVHMNNVGLTQLVMRVVNVKGFDEATAAQEQEAAERYRTPANKPSTSSSEDEINMTGFEALEFKFSVPFPLSLVISSKTVFRYQILFRYLLSMRHLEGLLVNSWEDHVKVLSWIHRSDDRKLEMWKRKAWTLRARMLIFVQQTLYYCTSEVIDLNWQALMARVNGRDEAGRADGGGKKTMRTVDELMEDHVDFLDTCLKECMLMNSKLLKIHSKLTSVCHLFATYTSSLSRTLFTCHPSLAGTPASLAYLTAHHYPNPAKRPIPDDLKHYNPAKLDSLYDMLGKYESNFEHHLKLLLDALDYYAATETVALSRLCAVLGSAMASGGSEGRVVF